MGSNQSVDLSGLPPAHQLYAMLLAQAAMPLHPASLPNLPSLSDPATLAFIQAQMMQQMPWTPNTEDNDNIDSRSTALGTAYTPPPLFTNPPPPFPLGSANMPADNYPSVSTSTSPIQPMNSMPALAPVGHTQPVVAADPPKRCGNSNCPQKGDDVDWVNGSISGIRMCRTCNEYYVKDRRYIHRPKELCDRQYAKQLREGRKPYARKSYPTPADQPYRHEENVIIYGIFEALPPNATQEQLKNAGSTASKQLCKNRSCKRILRHIQSDVYQSWKVAHKQSKRQSPAASLAGFDVHATEAQVPGPSNPSLQTSSTVNGFEFESLLALDQMLSQLNSDVAFPSAGSGAELLSETSTASDTLLSLDLEYWGSSEELGMDDPSLSSVLSSPEFNLRALDTPSPVLYPSILLPNGAAPPMKDSTMPTHEDTSSFSGSFTAFGMISESDPYDVQTTAWISPQ